MVSGGDALIAVGVPVGKDASKVNVFLNGKDVTGKFALSPDGSLLGLLDEPDPQTALQMGANQIVAFYEGVKSGELALTNHPVTGPIFSGPQEQPFVCETASFVLPSGATLGAALDSLCQTRTRIEYVYWSEPKKRFIHLENPAALPGDIAWATVEGRQVPMVVRVETGTVNRAIYQIAALYDPSSDTEPSPFSRAAGWNRKLVYSFGGGCSEGWYRQGNTVGSTTWYYDDSGVLQRPPYSILDYELLVRGYAVASSSLNVFAQNCNEVLAAESMAMVKERFIEAYGVPAFTIGWGCSGGAYQLHHIADNYPGLLDGLLVGCSYSEVSFATVHFVSDARLLNRYFRGDHFPAPSLSDDQRRAIGGVVNLATVGFMDTSAADRIVPTNCPATLSWELRYNLANNPDGARCDIFDHTVNIWGTKPNPLAPAGSKPIAMRPLDNVGVQYGLKALRDRAISIDQFLDLNERIGGFDSDGRLTASLSGSVPAKRSVADPATLPVAYRSGRMLYGGWGLKDVPIIDYRYYEDGFSNGTFHPRYHSFMTRERLRKANGSAANQVMLVEGSADWTFTSESGLVKHALDRLDAWLVRIAADATTDPLHVKVPRNKPADLREGCVPPGQRFPQFQAETVSIDSGACAAWYPVGIGSRAAAGGPTVADVAKCQLRSVDAAIAANDYGGASFSGAQLTRLKAIFPTGVCDWSKPGVGQPTQAEYQTLQPWQYFD